MARWTGLFVFLLGGPAYGLSPIPGEDKFEALTDDGTSGSAGAMLGVNQIGDDLYLQLTPRLDLSLGKVGVGIQVPLQMRLYNVKTKDSGPRDGDYGGIIRREDWDEPSEVLKVIRYVRYGHKRDTVYVRVGELAAEVGHGTIMSRYLNNLDMNTLRVGSQLDINTNYGGIETVVGDVGSVFTDTVQSRVVGGRLYFKPVSLSDPESVFNIFSIGTTVISDLNAPLNLQRDANGDPVADGTRFGVAGDTAQTVVGFDVDAELLNNDMIVLVPYSDLNKISGGGWGWHLGIQTTLFRGLPVRIPAKLEYRRFAGNYIPMYYSTFYEMERFNAQLSGPGALSKSRLVRSLNAEGINGYYGELAFDFAGLLQLGAFYEDYDKADPNLSAFLTVPALEVVQFKAYYSRTGITGSDDIFKFDDRSFLIAQARFEVVPFIYLVGQFSRRWLLEETANGAEYKANDQWNAGIEASFDF